MLFAWQAHLANLNRYNSGEVLYGTVSKKDQAYQNRGRGTSAYYNIVWVDFIFEGVPQRTLMDDYITDEQWNAVAVGDSVAFIVLPDKMVLNPRGEVSFYEPPLLQSTFEPALRRLDHYPWIALIAIVCGFLPPIIFHLRRRRRGRA